MSRYSYAALSVLLLAAGLGNGATVTRPGPAQKSARVGRKQPAMSDAELEKAIKARFATSKISTHHFQVHVQGGVATLEGATDVLQHKGTATRLAKNMGAIRVVNKIEVSEAAREKAASSLASGRRRAQVKRTESNARGEKRSQ